MLSDVRSKTIGKSSACEVPSLGLTEALSTVLHTCLVLVTG